MMHRIFTSLFAGAALLALSVPGAGDALAKTKVGFVYVGPIGDHGWTYQHDQARLAVEEMFGDDVETTYVENVSEGPDAARVVEQLARSGHDIIFTTSFGFMNPTITVAERFPDLKFEHATGFKRSDNVATYSARFYEGRYVAGTLAGLLTETDVIGYIASFPIPEVIRGINSAFLGARSVNPDVQFKIIWVSTWFDPGKEADAAKALIDQGVDVLMQHTDSPAPLQIAEEAGVYAIGQASDMSHFGPNAHLMSIVNNWSPYVQQRVKATMDGDWESIDTWDGIGAGMVGISEFNDSIPADIRGQAAAARDAIAAGDMHPFTGPINRQDGSVWLKEGETAADGDLLGMDFYVEGIEGALPK